MHTHSPPQVFDINLKKNISLFNIKDPINLFSGKLQNIIEDEVQGLFDGVTQTSSSSSQNTAKALWYSSVVTTVHSDGQSEASQETCAPIALINYANYNQLLHYKLY